MGEGRFDEDATRRLRLPSDQDASGRTLGDEELKLLEEALRSGTLTSTKGTFVKRFEADFAAATGAAHAVACASGTAAVHGAVAAIDPEPGEEIITSPITDMGAIAPILAQGAIPRFADVDPRTYNLTPRSVAEALSDRTRAIIVTHLFGSPADMAGIMAVADDAGVPVIEDCAQAYGATHDGRLVGMIGHIGTFSLQQGKHITTGEGGIVITDDDAAARRMRLFVNKAWGYGDPKPDHYFLAPNYRLSELQGAVAVAQLQKLDFSIARRQEIAALLDEALADVEGIGIPVTTAGGVHSYWKYPLDVDPEVIPGGPGAIAAHLRDYDVASAPRYIQKPAFRCQVFTEQRTFGSSRWPFPLAQPEALDYSADRFPGTFAALERILVLPINERYEERHVAYVADAIRAAVDAARSAS